MEHAEFFTIITFKKCKIWLTTNFISCELTCPKNSNFHISEADKAKVVLLTKVISGKVDLLFSPIRNYVYIFLCGICLKNKCCALCLSPLTFQMWNSHLKYSFVGLFSPSDLFNQTRQLYIGMQCKIIMEFLSVQL